MRIGIDSYSYHRLFGLVRPGEPPAPGPAMTGWTDALAEASYTGAEVLALQTMFLSSPSDFESEFSAAEHGMIGAVLCWGGAEGLAFGTDDAAPDCLRRWLETADRLDIRLMRIVVGGPALRGVESVKSQIERTVPLLAAAADQAAHLGVVIAVENHGDLRIGELCELLDRAGIEGPSICFDLVNVMRLGEDPIQTLSEIVDRVAMVQLRDCVGSSSADHVAGPRTVRLGQGAAPLAEGVDLLAAQAADDLVVCVELAQLGPGDDEREMVASGLDWLRARAHE